jgi:hypothetical protein
MYEILTCSVYVTLDFYATLPRTMGSIQPSIQWMSGKPSLGVKPEERMSWSVFPYTSS